MHACREAKKLWTKYYSKSKWYDNIWLERLIYNSKKLYKRNKFKTNHGELP